MTQSETAPLPAGREPGAPAPGGPNGPGGPSTQQWLTGVRVIAAIVVVLAIVFGTLLVVSSFFKREHTETKTISGTVRAIRVTDDVGDVRVRAAAAGEPARVTARVVKSFQDPRWSADLDGDTLEVLGDCDDRGVIFDCSVDFTITLPAGVPVTIESNTGDLSVVGPFNGVDAKTSTGDIAVREATGQVRIRTNTGDVRGLSIAGRDVTAETDTGDVRLTFDVQPDQVLAESNTGDVTIVVPDDGTVYDVETDTNTGDTGVDVIDVPDSPRKITAHTDTGDVRVTMP